MKPMLRLPKTIIKKFQQTSKMVKGITDNNDGCQVGREDTGDVTFREPKSSTSGSQLLIKEPRSSSPKKTSKGSPSPSPRSSPQRSRTPSPLRKSPGGSPRTTPRTTPRNSPRPSPRTSPKRTPSGSPTVTPSGSRRGFLSNSSKWSPKGTPRSSPRRTPSGSPLRSRSPATRSPRLSPNRSRSRSASINLSSSSLNSKRTLRSKRSNRSVASALDDFKFSAKKTLNEVITKLTPPERCIVINKLSNTDIRITKYDDNSSVESDLELVSTSLSDNDSFESSGLPVFCLTDPPDKLQRVTKKDSPWKAPLSPSRKTSSDKLPKFLTPDTTSSFFLDKPRHGGTLARTPRSLSPERAMDLPDTSNQPRPASFEVKVTVETGKNNKGGTEESVEDMAHSGEESDTPLTRSTLFANKPVGDDPLISIFPEDERLNTASRIQCFMEERRRNGQYTAVCLVLVAAIMGLYHAFRAQNAVLAGFLVPALIMLLYLLWVLYSAQRARAKQMQLARALGEVRTDDADGEDGERRRKKKKNKQENGNAKKAPRNRSPSPSSKRGGSPSKNSSANNTRANVDIDTALWI